jgi:hypothetical protein
VNRQMKLFMLEDKKSILLILLEAKNCLPILLEML